MFNMLSIGKKAVMTAQKQLEITAHNMSNVDTDGYSRQRLIQEPSVYVHDALGNYGTGVDMVRIERMRDLQLDIEFRKYNSDMGYWGAMSKNLTELERNVLETSDYGVNAMINGFFDSWETLSLNPFSNVHRMDVVDSAQKMIDSFTHLYDSIETQKKAIKFDLIAAADHINKISEDLSQIITHLAYDTADDRTANDLLDKFDLLVDQLSTYGNVKVYHRENGTISVYLGTDELCRNDISYKLQLHEGENLMTGEYEMYLGWKHVDTKIAGLTSGSINAMMDLKDKILPSYQRQLDDLVCKIVKEVNDIHFQGHSTADPTAPAAFFFAPKVTGVKDFQISKEIKANPGFIAASIDGYTGDNQIALALADLRHAQIFDGQTLTGAFADIVYNIGSDVRFANQSADRSEKILDQTNKFRESVKGVSIEEETANLMRFQHTLQAASKIITVADEVFKTIVGMV